MLIFIIIIGTKLKFPLTATELFIFVSCNVKLYTGNYCKGFDLCFFGSKDTDFSRSSSVHHLWLFSETFQMIQDTFCILDDLQYHQYACYSAGSVVRV